MLVIDDLHELDSDDALAWLEMLLTRLPAQLRVVLAHTRGAGARPAPAAARGRADRAARARPALLARRDARAARCGRDQRSRTRAAARSTSAPRGGRPACGWRRSRWPGTRIPTASWPSSPAASGPWPATSSPRCSSASRRTCASCSCARRSSSASAARLPMRSPAARAEAILQRLEDQNAFVTALDAAPHLVPLPPPVRRSPAPRAAARRAGERPVAAPRRGRVARTASGRPRSRPPPPRGR